jgi:integrase
MSYRITDYLPNEEERDDTPAVVHLDVPSDADQLSIRVQGDVRINLSLTRNNDSSTVAPFTGSGMDARLTHEAPMEHRTDTGRTCRAPDWDQIIDHWASEARLQQKADRYISQVRGCVRRLLDYNEIEQITEIRRQSVMDYLQMLNDEGVRGKPASPKTLNNNLAAFRAFFEWMLRSETAPASWVNPCEGIRPAYAVCKEGRAFTLEETMAICEAAERDELSDRPRSPKIRSPLYRTLRVTGIRIGVAKLLRVKNFEFHRDPCILYIPGVEGHRKESRERELVIPDVDREWFERKFHGRHPEDPAFCNVTLNTLKLDARLAGVDLVDSRERGVGYHCFRRFVGTELDRMNVSPNLIQKQLGHRSIKTTLTSYVKRDLNEASSALSELSEKMSSKNPERPVDSGDLCSQGMRVDPDQPETHHQTVSRDAQGPETRDRHDSEPAYARGGEPRPRASQRRDSGMGYTGLEPVDIPTPVRDEIVRLLNREVTLAEQRTNLLIELLHRSPQRAIHDNRTEDARHHQSQVREHQATQSGRDHTAGQPDRDRGTQRPGQEQRAGLDHDGAGREKDPPRPADPRWGNQRAG